jgi:hypothetical protein
MSEFLVDSNDRASIDALIAAFGISDPASVAAIRTAVSLCHRPFTLQLDHTTRQSLSPLHDQFTFNLDDDTLIVFSTRAETLLDALIEMAMFLKGFNTLMGLEDEWKVNIAIGAWRYMRRDLRRLYNLFPSPGPDWSVPLDAAIVEDYTYFAFNTVVFFACHPAVEVIFPAEANPVVVAAFERIEHIVQSIPANLTLDDYMLFNRRLATALLLIEDHIVPDDDHSITLDDLSDPHLDDLDR